MCNMYCMSLATDNQRSIGPSGNKGGGGIRNSRARVRARHLVPLTLRIMVARGGGVFLTANGLSLHNDILCARAPPCAMS